MIVVAKCVATPSATLYSRPMQHGEFRDDRLATVYDVAYPWSRDDDFFLSVLAERPAIKGISLPGMPAGSPGMDGEKTGPFTIYEIGDGAPKVFARE